MTAAVGRMWLPLGIKFSILSEQLCLALTSTSSPNSKLLNSDKSRSSSFILDTAPDLKDMQE